MHKRRATPKKTLRSESRIYRRSSDGAQVLVCVGGRIGSSAEAKGAALAVA